MTYPARDRQTLIDVALQERGTADAVAYLAFASGKPGDYVCASGDPLTIPDYTPLKEQVRQALEQRRRDANGNPTPLVTGFIPESTPLTGQGLNYWAFPFAVGPVSDQ